MTLNLSDLKAKAEELQHISNRDHKDFAGYKGMLAYAIAGFHDALTPSVVLALIARIETAERDGFNEGVEAAARVCDEPISLALTNMAESITNENDLDAAVQESFANSFLSIAESIRALKRPNKD